jgi:hypothetical protein
MKIHAIFSGIAILALAACSTSYHTTSHVDDIYYTPEVVRPAGNTVTYTEAKVVEVPQEAARPDNNLSYDQNDQTYQNNNQYNNQSYDNLEQITDDQGNVYISNYYGDVYDYAYSSRIRRFYRPGLGSSYYDPFYTNMYWYNYDPFYSGVSIYMGYGAMPFYYPGYYWNPAFRWHMNWGYGYGWAYDPFGYNYWYSPYSFYSPYGFMSAYNYGFSSGYYLGHYNNPYYYQYLYNSYDQSNYHYGPRMASGSSTRLRGGRSAAGTTGSAGTFAERFETSTARNADGVRENVPVSDRSLSRAGSRDASGSVKSDDEPAGRPQRGGASSGQTVTQPRAGETAIGRSGDEGNRNIPANATRPTRNTSQTGEQTITQPQSRPNATPSRAQTRPDAATQTRPTATPATRPVRQEASTQTRPQSSTERYGRPEQFNPGTIQSRDKQTNQTPPRTYTSPSYQQPRSNEQYRNPQTARPTVTPPREAAPATRGESQPDRRQIAPQTRPVPQQARPQTAPQRQDRGQPSYTPPPRQQTPTRSVPSARPASTPSSRPSAAPSSAPRSTPSVSPSRSSGSSAAPARSSGSSGSPSRSSSSGRSRP